MKFKFNFKLLELFYHSKLLDGHNTQNRLSTLDPVSTVKMRVLVRTVDTGKNVYQEDKTTAAEEAWKRSEAKHLKRQFT